MTKRNIIIGVVVAVAVVACLGLILAWAIGGRAWNLLPIRPGDLGLMPHGPDGWRLGLPMMRHVARPMFFLGPLAWLLGLVALGGLVALLVTRNRARPGSTGTEAGRAPESPLEILQRRYAAGEIDREQYEQMRRDLS